MQFFNVMNTYIENESYVPKQQTKHRSILIRLFTEYANNRYTTVDPEQQHVNGVVCNSIAIVLKNLWSYKLLDVGHVGRRLKPLLMTRISISMIICAEYEKNQSMCYWMHHTQRPGWWGNSGIRHSRWCPHRQHLVQGAQLNYTIYRKIFSSEVSNVKVVPKKKKSAPHSTT